MTARSRLHPAYLAAALIFVVLLVRAGLRSTPGVLMLPLEQAFGWSRSTVSFAASATRTWTLWACLDTGVAQTG